MTTTTPLAIGKCPKCRTAVTCTKAEAIEASWQVRSACCGRWTVVKAIAGTTTTRECGEHCTDATTATCKCECGGAAHGLAWRIR